MDEKPALHRTLGFRALLAYGVGDMLGAGIYALVGKVAGEAGTWAWLAFAIAMFVAALTALTYSELVTRFPRSGGEAYYCERAYRRSWIALLIGWLVFCSGLVSLAAVTHGFTDYVEALYPQPPRWAIYLLLLIALAAINFWGIRHSSTANIICTGIEASGLLLVLVVGLLFLAGDSSADTAAARGAAGASAQAAPAAFAVGLLTAATLAFYSFIGFEDMVNVAEEVREPQRTFPAAILCAMAVVSLVYMAVTYVAVRVVPPSELAAEDGPLLTVVRVAAPWVPEKLFAGIALFAVANTGLLNFIMASRLVYGMARQRLLPGWLESIHPSRRTPHRAIVVCFLFAVILTFSGTLTFLAGATSVLLLLVFAVINGALLVLKRRESKGGVREADTDPSGHFRVPWVFPLLGMAVSIGLLAFTGRGALLRAAILIVLGLALVAWRQVGLSRQPGA